MKQHLLGSQLMELPFEERIILLSIVTGLNITKMKEEYEKGIRDEGGMLAAYGFQVDIGSLIEIVEDYTEQFPSPVIKHEKYAVKLSVKDAENEFYSDFHDTYCDALFEIVKKLLAKKIIEII